MMKSYQPVRTIIFIQIFLSLFPKPLLHPRPVSFSKKRKTLAVALYSHCEKVRTEYLIELMKEIDVDSYGGCLHNTDLPEHIEKRNEQNFSKVSMSLINLYKTYKFTLVFLNNDCDYFVDEKLFYALSAGSVPVFMGTDKIHDFLPGNLNNSVIEVRNFASPRALAEYMKYLANNEMAYNKFLQWKYQGFKFPKNYKNSTIGKLWSGAQSVFCNVCQRIASGDWGRNGLPVEHCKRKTVSYQ
ncbi:alpha-(1,3)-fucosyltransferase 10-like [Xenia sp. Carnegie-2017]|uniref:alpha-(1,3)-fucosyltransferase 10-like n=1 Tax=Xenia sp. Carnegie-2017 TaxID=2897299 RepID=UPI001F041DFF|nr:alpha-(1,3)-fucosyltransferase 10-like [Xenia sp. Carnegie-2017]